MVVGSPPVRVGRRQAIQRVPDEVLFFCVLKSFSMQTVRSKVNSVPFKSRSEDGEEQEGRGRKGESTGVGIRP